MKKLVGYILSHTCFYIGDAFCKISSLKNKGNYVFDGEEKTIRYKIGYWLAGQYQRFMHYSTILQDWAGNKTPWETVPQDDNYV